jgi:hypothetical protein
MKNLIYRSVYDATNRVIAKYNDCTIEQAEKLIAEYSPCYARKHLVALDGNGGSCEMCTLVCRQYRVPREAATESGACPGCPHQAKEVCYMQKTFLAFNNPVMTAEQFVQACKERAVKLQRILELNEIVED